MTDKIASNNLNSIGFKFLLLRSTFGLLFIHEYIEINNTSGYIWRESWISQNCLNVYIWAAPKSIGSRHDSRWQQSKGNN